MTTRILLIEDNIDHILFTKRILEAREGYLLESVSDAREGLKKALEDNYDLVICDYRMPQVTALDMLKEIRLKKIIVPFIVITASGSEKAAVDLMKEGAYDYIIKDYSFEENLPIVVERSLVSYKAQKEKIALEEEIERQKAFLETVINSLNYPFYVINRDYSIVLANKAAKEKGITEGGFCYRLTHNSGHPCKGEHLCPMLELLRTGLPTQAEHIHYDKDGNELYVEVHGDPIFGKDGQVTQIIEYTIDITGRKKAEEELKNTYQKLKDAQQQLIQSSKMAAMGQLAAGISHELNQPLTGIKGFAQAALIGLDKDNSLRGDLSKIVEQADRMDKIISNVRLFARKSDFALKELDINEPLEDALMLLSQQLKMHNIRLVLKLEKGLPKISGDRNQLQQVFLNLIANARDAIDSLQSPEGGEVTIESFLSEDKENIIIVLRDTGCGISQENLDNIFNPFFTTKFPKDGTGMGLSIVYSIIENHKGHIEAESEGSKGAVFTITLPVIKEKVYG